MLHENDPDAYLSRAREALRRGAWRAALSDATSALGSAIYDSRAWKIKGTAHFQLEEYSEAAEALLDDDTPVAQSMMRRLGLPTSGSVPPGCRPLLELQLKLGALHERGRLGEIFSAASVVLDTDGEASIGRHDLGRAAQLVLGVVLTRAQSEAAVAWIAGERTGATSVTLSEMEARLDELAHNPVYSDDDEDETNSQASPPLSPGTDPPVSPGSDPPASPGSDFSN